MEIVTYKCPCCDGALEFGSDSQMLECPYCEGKYTLEAIKEYYGEKDEKEEDIKWKPYTSESGNGDWKDTEREGMKVYICPACAAEIIADETTGATSCIYCGNPTIIPKQFEGSFRPDYIIPFKVNKEAAMEALKKFWKEKKLLPSSFKKEYKIEDIKGIYVPFWLFDCDTHSNIRYKATRTKVWSDSEYNYKRTDHYMVTREGNLSFNKVPADGSSKMDDDYMQSIEPFNYNEAVDFDIAYLSGYLADKYDVDANSTTDKVNERIKNSTKTLFDNTVAGYEAVIPENVNIRLQHGDIKYALLPVWMLNGKYKDKVYTFAMNGQTGKFIGELPTSWGKFWGWFFGIFATIFLILLSGLLFI